jgi:hypothetical protein
MDRVKHKNSNLVRIKKSPCTRKMPSIKKLWMA